MRFVFSVFVAASVLLVAGCAQSYRTVPDTFKISGPKEVAIYGERKPWTLEIQQRLAAQGFTIKRFVNTGAVSRITGNTITTTSNIATRYIIAVEANASLNWARKCFGGGVNLDYINVEVVDTQTNETLLTVTDSGYTEGCPPWPSNVYGNIVGQISGLWR